MKYVCVLILNILYCVMLLYHPKSFLYVIHEDPTEVIIYKCAIISGDAASYTDPPTKDNFRTIGYPYILDFLMMFNNWFILLLLLNCIAATWLFYVVYQMIGNKAWILVFLGTFTLHIPFILTDLLFASIFVTAIWQTKKRLWLHFLLLGVASLIRPSLQWYFIIEPFTLYFYGYRGKILYYSFFMVFAATSFNSFRNVINHGQFAHSTVLKYNINADAYFGSVIDNGVIKYIFHSCVSNLFDTHIKLLRLFFPNRTSNLWVVIPYVYIGMNMLIWLRYSILFIQRKVNYGNVLIILYFMAPAIFAANGGRMRLPFEWMLFF